MNFNVGKPKLLQEACAEFNHLNINARASVPDRLHVELRELAISTLLWSVMTEEWSDGDEAHRLRGTAHAVLDVRAEDSRGCFWSQCERRGILCMRSEPIELAIGEMMRW